MNYDFMFATKYSRFMRAMFSREMPFGHSISQAPVLVQFPKPSASIWLTMFFTRAVASTCPCGSKASWETFAETNSIADEFLQVATQAPQPMHAAASKAASASGFGMGILFASCALPVLTEIYPPFAIMRSNAERSTVRSLITGNAFALHGSTTMVSPFLNERM